MPAIVIGADTEVGLAVVNALTDRPGEVRAFVTRPAIAAELKKLGAKVAVGDVSDASHIGPASLNAFSAVLIAEAAFDDRERSFAGNPEAVFAVWAEGLLDAEVKRLIWVGADTAPEALVKAAPEFFAVAILNRDAAAIGREVAEIDDSA